MTRNNNQEICGADEKQKRECPIVTPSYSACSRCPFCNGFEVDLGQPGLRGGVENLSDLLKWRRVKKEKGISHGDAE